MSFPLVTLLSHDPMASKHRFILFDDGVERTCSCYTIFRYLAYPFVLFCSVKNGNLSDDHQYSFNFRPYQGSYCNVETAD